MRSPRSWRAAPVLGALVAMALVPALLPADASAGWPPPSNATPADLADPSNWPSDPGYGFSSTSDGQWNFYGFMPSTATSVRKQETATGMSIDLAWAQTIGDDRVHIAITDSGIEWDEPDLIDKVWLNAKELANHKPQKADGTACGGTGELAGYDCNGDGIFSVSDYASSPNLTPPASAGHPLGDKNGNGILDAGDIILNFSDGVDDDQNGYVDDIAGWDFMKDDNDPYDDTRYGHGTGEAKDSSAATNNMIENAGACPLCRFIPLRAGDSFITDVTDFGKAVVYATDNGAQIVQCALGTINNNRFSQAALDYAWAHGVLSINSMADEDSRHHNMPTSSNHTLPVHAIDYDGQSVATSTTFLNFNSCTNYGGQNMLSASGSSCSSEATGKLSGIAGLVYAEALKTGLTPPLTPGEAHSLFFSTADDINVAESEQANSIYAWSQPGFDQRFGYGRVNAATAVSAVRDGKIPPDVDIVSPTWFSVLYADQAPAKAEIMGSVSAKRAPSFDYKVEWAPGVQPLDSLFTTVASMSNVPGTMTIGGTTSSASPLATLDLTKIDPTHPRDSDSPYGENDTAITIRVQAVAHYGGTIGDIPGEARRTYYVQKDPTLFSGFPIHLGESGENSPKLADIDGDGVRDLVYPTSGGQLHVYKLTGASPVELPGFPFQANREDGLATPAPTASTPVYLSAPGYSSASGVDPDLARDPFGTAPAVADIDGDGKPEIVASTWSGTIYVIGANGAVKPGWPVRLPLVPSCPLDPTLPVVQPCMSTTSRIARGSFAAPVLAPITGDGTLKVIQAAFDGKVYAFNADGTPVDGWPVTIHYTGSLTTAPDTNRILTTPAVGDFNGDGIPDLLVGSNEKLGTGGVGAAYIIDGRGNKATQTVLTNWPVTVTSLNLFPVIAEGLPNSGVIGTFDGAPAAVFHGNGSSPVILPADPGVQSSLAVTPPSSLPKHADPSSTSPCTKASDCTTTGDTCESGTCMTRGLGTSFGPNSQAPAPNTMLPLFAQPSLGDIDQDGVPDVIATGGSLRLAAALDTPTYTSTAGTNLVSMWSGATGAMLPGSPMVLEDFTFFNSQAIADLDGDDYPEVITGSGGYFVHAYNGCGTEPEGWPKFTGQWVISTAAVGDVDGDGTLDVAIASRDGWLYLWHTTGSAKGIVEWESFHHDNMNTGNLDTKLTQGTAGRKAAKPLTADLCTSLATSSSSSSSGSTSSSSSSSSGKVITSTGGGCSCRASDGDASIAGTSALLGLGLLGLRRRRRHVRGSATAAPPSRAA